MNNKGMSLVEEIVALAIISLASLIMLVGFSTAANVFADSTKYKNITNEQYQVLLNKDYNSENVILSENMANATIKVGANTFTVEGKQRKATSNKEMLSAFEFEINNDVTENQGNTDKTLSNIDNYIKEVAGLKNEGDFLTWLKDKKGIIVPPEEAYGNSDTNNSNFYQHYYYYAHGKSYLQLEQNIIDECNRIFDSVHQNATDENEKSMRIGDKKLYIKPVFCDGLWGINGEDKTNGYFLIASESPELILTDKKDTQLNTKLIYARGKWYYKIFGLDENYQNAFVDVAEFSNNNSNETVDDLYNGSKGIDLNDQTNWAVIQ